MNNMRSMRDTPHSLVTRGQVVWAVVNIKGAADPILQKTLNLVWAALVPRAPCALSFVCAAAAELASPFFRRPNS